jgi:hypothetical protein
VRFPRMSIRRLSRISRDDPGCDQGRFWVLTVAVLAST